MRPQGAQRTGQPRRARLPECPRSPRMGVSKASGYNLAAFALGSGRCRGPERGTPKLPRLPRRTERAVARGGECGTQSIGAHAGKRADVRRGSEAGKGRIG